MVKKKIKEFEKNQFEKVQAEKVQAEKVSGREILPEFRLADTVISRAVSAPAVAVPSPASPIAAPTGAAFIRAEERPSVEETVLNPPVQGEPSADAVTKHAIVAPPLTPANQAVDPLPDRKPTEKPLAAEKGIMAERLGDRPIQ